MPKLRSVDQMGFDEQVIADSEVEAALEERHKRREELSLYRAESKQADDVAIAAIARLELPMDGAARVGRFRITRTMSKTRSVSFEAGAKERISIALVDE